jgi:pimeloyl-ACP methyl ester carboxylesterase
MIRGLIVPITILASTTHAHLDRPATLIQGTYDRTVYRENLEHAKLPDSLDLRWVDTGHHTAIDQPDIVLDAINDVS